MTEDIGKLLMTGLNISTSLKMGKCRRCGAPAREVLYKGQMVPGVHCQKCSDEVEAEIEAYERSMQAEKEKAYRDRTRQLFEQSNLGAKFERATFETFEKREGTAAALSACRKWAAAWPPKNGKGLVIEGPTGSGKTHLAAAVTHELLEKGIEVIFQSVPDLLLRIRSTFNAKTEISEEQILRRLISTELLVLDDLGAENMTGWTEATIYNLIDQRYRHERPVIITTNLNLADIGDRIGPRTMDRLAESYTSVRVRATSYRRRTKNDEVGEAVQRV